MNYDDLRKLDELRKEGVISEEEYQREKEKFFNRTGNSQSEKPLFGLSENSYIALMHVSQLGGFLLPGLGFAAPVILWMLNKDNNAKIDAVGKHIINFMISMFLFYVISGVLVCLGIGLLMLAALSIVHIVFIIIATLKANNGESWKYPLTIDILK
jgi:uncharacterized Tic20 family protein